MEMTAGFEGISRADLEAIEATAREYDEARGAHSARRTRRAVRRISR